MTQNVYGLLSAADFDINKGKRQDLTPLPVADSRTACQAKSVSLAFFG